jgi:hypothetical protein
MRSFKRRVVMELVCPTMRCMSVLRSGVARLPDRADRFSGILDHYLRYRERLALDFERDTLPTNLFAPEIWLKRGQIGTCGFSA